MRCILSDHTDPFFNLASEEVLLKSRSDDYFLLYRNVPTVIVGKHQNALAELNLSYLREKGIRVARRISGGGTVYQDLGNLNFAFVTSGRVGELVDYRRYTQPIIGALARVGLDVTLGNHHELLLGGKKISGTASHVFKHRVLHHGTLLFSVLMDDLSFALQAPEASFSDRGVRSVRSQVTNIADHLVDKMDLPDLQNLILHHILDTMNGARKSHFTPRDLDDINQLAKSRFSSWAWIFGYSPRYQFSKALKSGTANISLHLNVEKGIIREVNIDGDIHGGKDVRALQELLVGTIHDPETIRQRLSGIKVSDFIRGLGNEEFLSGMF
jgi:lipoate-protein ligase A